MHLLAIIPRRSCPRKGVNTKNMKEALYIENGFWQSEGTRALKRSLTEAGQRQGLRLIARPNTDFMRPDSLRGLPKTALFWDKDLRLAEEMERAGLRLFNRAEAIRLCDDKTLTWLHLKGSGIPMPDTLLCPMTFPNVGYTVTAFLKEAADVLGLPFVIKQGRGSFGSQVYLVHSVAEAVDILCPCAGEPVLFQRFVSESAGRDVRVYVVGGRVVASMGRVNLTGDFRANVENGGKAVAHAPTPREEELALQACRLLGLDFGGVDLLYGQDGPLLCEVNSNAHFKALQAVSGVSPADAIVAHMLEHMP